MKQTKQIRAMVKVVKEKPTNIKQSQDIFSPLEEEGMG